MTKIKVLAWIHIVLSGTLLLIGLWLVVAIALSADKDSRAPEMILPMVGSLSLFVLIPGFVGGVGLLFLQPWARVLIIVLSLMELLFVPIGTVLGGFGLWVLLGHEAQRVFGDKTVARLMERAASGETTTLGPSLGVIAAAAGVGAGFIVFIGAGFMISGDTAPPELMTLFYPAVAVLIAAIAYGVYSLIAPRLSARP
jgi:hypothetical protein